MPCFLRGKLLGFVFMRDENLRQNDVHRHIWHIIRSFGKRGHQISELPVQRLAEGKVERLDEIADHELCQKISYSSNAQCITYSSLIPRT